MTEYRTLNDDNAPTIWPQCDCGMSFVFRKGLTMQGMRWTWVADCKHPKKETHQPILMTADGPYEAPK